MTDENNQVKFFLYKNWAHTKTGQHTVERARLIKEANFPVLLCTAKFNFSKPHLFKLCWVWSGSKQSSMDNQSQFQGMVYFNACAVYDTCLWYVNFVSYYVLTMRSTAFHLFQAARYFNKLGHVSIVDVRTKRVENPSCGNSFLSSEIFFSRCLALF